jgi:hypothetical protein
MSSIEEYAQTYNDLSDNNEYTQIPLIPNEWKVLKDRYAYRSWTGN